MNNHLHIELAEHFGSGEDAEGDLVDTVVLHVERVDGGELGRAAHWVRLETVPRQRQTRQVHQTGQKPLRRNRHGSIKYTQTGQWQIID